MLLKPIKLFILHERIAWYGFHLLYNNTKGAGQLTQKPTHPQKKWSTHPNSWITHPSILDNSPKF